MLCIKGLKKPSVLYWRMWKAFKPTALGLTSSEKFVGVNITLVGIWQTLRDRLILRSGRGEILQTDAN
jgi:hypothetical protein